MTHLHLSEDFHQEDIEFNLSIFNPLVAMLVVNQLHKSSSILLRILRFYEDVSTMSNPSLLYLRLLQASFGGYVASITTNNSEYQQRWSAFVFFQLPRLLASSFDFHFDHLKQAMETFLLHNEYILNRMDELCVENVLESVLQSTLNYTKNDIKEKNQQKIHQLTLYIQKIRGPYVQQVQHYYQTHQTRSFPFFTVRPFRCGIFCCRSVFVSSSPIATHARTIVGENLRRGFYDQCRRKYPNFGEKSDRIHSVDLRVGSLLSVDPFASLVHGNTFRSGTLHALLHHDDHRRSLGGFRNFAAERRKIVIERLSHLHLVEKVLVGAIRRSRTLRLVVGLDRSPSSGQSIVPRSFLGGQRRISERNSNRSIGEFPHQIFVARLSEQNDSSARRIALVVFGRNERNRRAVGQISQSSVVRHSGTRSTLVNRQLSDRQRR